MTRRILRALSCVLLVVTAGTPAVAQTPLVEFKKGDHVVFIGNALPERMQHFGYLETLLHDRLPDHELYIRNLGYAGDEVAVRLRVQGFGTPDEHLSFHKADVIFAFFGFNESFRGKEGLDQFRREFDDFLRHTLQEKYNGHTPPRLVVFSPIAYERLDNPNLPDGTEINHNLRMYTAAMRELCEARHVPFVDLFGPTLELYQKYEQPLTINGCHLNELGNRLVAEVIDEALFGPRVEPINWARLEKLRQAVLDKNFHWFHRYRTTDGYNVYGGRSYLKYTDGISNRDVLQREMEVLDVMCANRDRRIWAIAQGGDLQIDDSNTPPFIEVKTNAPGPGPNGEHIFLGGEEAISRMTTGKNLQVNLFASEEMFPELVNPVQMAFDTKGRLWVAVWPTYPHWKPKEPMNDKLLILEDTDGDGKADVCKTFADNLNNPSGFEFWNGGVFVAMAPYILFLKDTDGDDRADVQIRIMSHVDSADTHHTANSFVIGPEGALYFQEGIFHRSQIESPYGVQRNIDACVWRFEPLTWRIERYIPYGFANPHGHVFDRWGQDIVVDGTGAVPYHATLFSGYLDYPKRHDKPPTLYRQRTRPCPGIEILSSRHFPEEFQGNLLVANVIGFQGILRYRIRENGASYVGEELEPILFSSDPNFRPVDIEVGPDGAIYFCDWHNPLIGHMQHHIRDPNRDKTHGRVYRVTYRGRPLLEPKPIAGQPIEKLLDLLKEPEDRVRYRARIELSARPTRDVLAAADRWLERLDRDDPDYEHHVLEILWLYSQHNVVNEPLLDRVLSFRDHRARAAATRVLCYWRDRVSDPLGRLARLVLDDHPLVRLEAVRACSFFRDARAAEIALDVLKKPMDEYLYYTLGETMKQLEPWWKEAVQSGRPFASDNPAGIRYLLRNVDTATLVKLPRSRLVYEALLARAEVPPKYRVEAIRELARLNGTAPVVEVVAAIERLDASADAESERVLHDLAHLLFAGSHAATAEADHESSLHIEPADLTSVRARLERLLLEGQKPFTRELAAGALALADGSVDRLWTLASSDAAVLYDVLVALPDIPDPALRVQLRDRVLGVLRGQYPAPVAQQLAAPGQRARLERRIGEQPELAIRRAAAIALVAAGGDLGETFRILAEIAQEGGPLRDSAISGLSQIPRSAWPPDAIEPLLQSIIAFLANTPPKERTSPSARRALELGYELATALRTDKGKQYREQLEELGVRVIVIRPVPHMLLFDKKEIYVEAGKPVEIVFENTDVMPHNLVIGRPGSLLTIGKASDDIAVDPRGYQRGFVPRIREIMYHTKLLQPGERDRITFVAPRRPDDYPYVCTFPGHWRRMNGVMHVVRDLDEVAPEQLAAAETPVSPLPPARKFVREWTLADLAPFVEEISPQRDLVRGRKLFEELACAKCHAVNGQGGGVGPDVREIRQKVAGGEYNKLYILQSIVDPSHDVAAEYRTTVIATTKGQLISGIVQEEKDGKITLRVNPLDAGQTEPIVIAESDIEERVESRTSLMPQGLLNTADRDEILDLVSYLLYGLPEEESPVTAGGGE